ncbi:hypothetical protein P7C73_g1140, partial [Tremellales sp. Uapishka_1]
MENSIYYSSDTALARLCRRDAIDYLKRINIAEPEQCLRLPPSLDLLSHLQMQHMLTVPYDTSPMHVNWSEWSGPARPIVFGQGSGMGLGEWTFNRIVHGHASGFCFAINCLFASLLRTLGYRVSEVGARNNLRRGSDFAKVPCAFSAITHIVLLVDWPAGPGRYFVDAGYGGGSCPFPFVTFLPTSDRLLILWSFRILLQDGQTSRSLLSTESFRLRQEVLRVDSDIWHDPPSGFSVYRRVTPPDYPIIDSSNADATPGFWTLMYHFAETSLSPGDAMVCNFFNEKHPQATWATFFVVSLMLPNGARRTLARSSTLKDEKGRAKLYTKAGITATDESVEWIDFDTRAIGEVLRKDFGYRFGWAQQGDEPKYDQQNV